MCAKTGGTGFPHPFSCGPPSVIHGSTRFFLRIIEMLCLAVLVAGGVLSLRLAQGPLELGDLTPYLQDVVNRDYPDHRLDIGSAALAWETANRNLTIRFRDVTLHGKAADQEGQDTMARLPEVSVVLDGVALLSLHIRPYSIDILRPFINVVREADGSFHLGIAAVSPSASPSGAAIPPPDSGMTDGQLFVQAMLGDLINDQGSRLHELHMSGANAVFTDVRLGGVWQMPSATLNLARLIDGTIGVTGAVVVQGPSGNSTLDLAGSYDPKTASATVDATIAHVRPSALANLDPHLAPLKALDIDLSGHVGVDFAVGPRVIARGMHFEVTGKGGQLHIPAPLNRTVGVETVVVAGSLNGSIPELDSIILTRFDLDLAEGMVEQTHPDHPGTPVHIGLSGHLDKKNDIIAGPIEVSVDHLAIDSLRNWWPVGFADGGRKWVGDNLVGGMASHAEWHLGFSGPSLDDLTVVSLVGTAHAEHADVYYFRPMEPIKDASADVTFGLDTVKIVAIGAKLHGLTARSAEMLITAANTRVPQGALSFTVAGALPDALAVIDEKPLGFTSKFGLKPDQTSGSAVATVTLSFPLLEVLPVDQIHFGVEATLTDAGVKKAAFGHDIDHANLQLSVDNSHLKASGTSTLGGVPSTFTWQENFNGKPYRSHYTLAGTLTESQRAIFGMTVAPLTPSYIGGDMPLNVDITTFSTGATVLVANADLNGCSMAIDELGWSKAVAKPATLTATLHFTKSRLADISRFQVVAEGGEPLSVEGKATFDELSALASLDLTTAKIGATNATIHAARRKATEPWAVRAQGSFLDARWLLHRVATTPTAPTTVPAAGSSNDHSDDMTVDLGFEGVRLAEQGELQHFTAHAQRSGGLWRQIAAQSEVSNGKPWEFSLQSPDANDTSDTRTIHLASDDAGTFLRTLGLTSTLHGGVLNLDGTLSPTGDATGKVVIDDYRLVKAPLLARVLSIAALTGVLDSLSGEGIGFKQLIAPFDLKGRVLTINEGHAAGSALGFTATGTIDLAEGALNLTGTIVPAYAVNGLVQDLPLLGILLTNNETGGGLFAADYSMRGPYENPNITVNPLSTLTPGFLRSIFGVFH